MFTVHIVIKSTWKWKMKNTHWHFSVFSPWQPPIPRWTNVNFVFIRLICPMLAFQFSFWNFSAHPFDFILLRCVHHICIYEIVVAWAMSKYRVDLFCIDSLHKMCAWCGILCLILLTKQAIIIWGTKGTNSDSDSDRNSNSTSLSTFCLTWFFVSYQFLHANSTSDPSTTICVYDKFQIGQYTAEPDLSLSIYSTKFVKWKMRFRFRNKNPSWHIHSVFRMTIAMNAICMYFLPATATYIHKVQTN